MDLVARAVGYRGKPTFKSVGASPVSLTKYKFINEVLPHVDQYWLTDKTDGERAFLVKSHEGWLCVTGSGTWPRTLDWKIGPTILDCELHGDTIWIFDVMEWDGQFMNHSPWEQRLACLNKVPEPLCRKVFHKLTHATYQKKIMEVWDSRKKKPYEVDGLIMTRGGAGYAKTIHYKWKPLSHLTVDFLLWHGRLLCGISKSMFHQVGLDKVVSPVGELHDALRQYGINIRQEYFPIPFTPSILPQGVSIEQVQTLEAPEHHGYIIEARWEGRWIFLRQRHDREKELRAGTVYGNNYRVAELTFQSILNPLELSDLVESRMSLIQDIYFQSSDNRYKDVRKFNNHVKVMLLKRWSNTSHVIDMASGKGQDLLKYVQANVGQLYMLEWDATAVDELLSRKFNILQSGLWLQVSRMDLNAPAKKNILELESRGFHAGQVPLVVCNFAFHYLMVSPATGQNVVSFISHFLAPQGSFLLTIFDITRVRRLVGARSWTRENYHIEWIAGTGRGYGNHIKVKLPCTQGTRDEYLVDLYELDKLFLSSGITRVETEGFDRFLEGYQRSLSAWDREFASLYQYAIYMRNK